MRILRALGAVATWVVGCAAFPAVLLAASIQSLNQLPLLDGVIIALWLWLLFTCALAGPLVGTALLLRAMGRACRARQLAGVTLAGLFGLLWFSRLEPAHQLLSIRPHLSVVGATELILIAVACAGILYGMRFRGLARVAATTLMIAAGAAMMFATVAGLEPGRDRTRFVTSLAAARPDRPRTASPAPRVLVIGIDGLEWKALDWMIRGGRLPTIAALLDRGRFFQLDNRGMAISPPIWTALYTGYPPHDNGVGGFTEWHFRGTTSIVAFLPRFGVHPVWMIDLLLEQFDLFQGWQEIESSTLRIKKPPIWTIASASGRRVGIFSPVPYATAGERVNGFFVWPGRDDDFNVSRQESVGHATQAVVPLPPERVAAAGTIDTGERTRVETAMRFFAESKPDLGVYYTHFVDSLSHTNWDFRFPTGWFGGDPAGILDARFDTTSIARGYLQADAEVLDLITAFGPSTVILVSDHGWDFNDYEHFLSPNGVLIVANTGAQGYGGVVDLLSVAPTILSLLGVPVAADMQAVIGDLTAGARVADYRGLHQDFIPDQSPIDPNQLDLLRSIGYLRGR